VFTELYYGSNGDGLSTKKQKLSLRKKFGRRIRSLRLKDGMTQERLAEVSGISVDFLSLIERGRNSPSFETLELLSASLKIPVAMLFMFDEDE
jgi:transcriptional regulator with XRE-family HTH domain